jgi:hypothetical protein
MILATCARCGHTLQAPDAYVGRTAKCPSCGEPVRLLDPAASFPVLDQQDADRAPTKTPAGRVPAETVEPSPIRTLDVRIVGVKLPFWDMVVLLVTVALAALPALLALLGIGLLAAMVLSRLLRPG